MRNDIRDALLSLLCGIALLAGARALYGIGVGHLPDDLLIDGADPLTRLALARLALFAAVVAPLAFALSWPLARHATRKDLAVVLPGAACGGLLFLLLDVATGFDPFPAWLGSLCALVLFASLPLATAFWWRRRR